METQIAKVLCQILLLHQIIFAFTQAQQCRPQEYYLASAQPPLNITSPNYPRAYAPGSNCRYRIIAPLDHVVVLTCHFEVYPNSCGTEYFYVSRDGDFQFRDAETFCNGGRIVRTSHFRAIGFAYYSSMPTTSLQGRFHCQAYARRQSCTCGWTTSTRITNGTETLRHEYPSMVALRDVTSNQRIFCGGSIISHRHILTAAHCTRFQPDVNRILAYVGDHDLTSSTESAFEAQHRIQQIFNHPEFSNTAAGMANDIALLVTATLIEWSRGVGPICLPMRQAAESFAYVNVDVTGWGTLSFAGSKSNTLQKVQLLTMDNAVCQRQYNATILPAQLCTYDYLGLGQDSCQFDSGGPVILRQSSRMLLLGIISFGRTCGLRYAIGVNTRVTAHLNWLRRYVGGGICAA